MLEKNLDKAKKFCIAWKRSKVRCKRAAGLTLELSTRDEGKRGHSNIASVHFQAKSSHGIYRAVTFRQRSGGDNNKSSIPLGRRKKTKQTNIYILLNIYIYLIYV